MASFTAGTTFVDGVSNDVTAAKLGALVTNATPTSGFIQDRTAETVTATNDTLLIGDASDSNNLKRITVANFAQTLPTAKVTTGTIETGTFGTTTSTAATITTGTIGTLVATGTITGSTNVINIGSGQIYKDASGNVGIGFTTPGSYGGYTTLSINNTTGGLIDLCSSGTVQGQIFSSGTEMRLTKTGANPITAFINGAERLRIDSSGNVGIGTNSPSTFGVGSKLVVAGAVTNGSINYSATFSDGTTNQLRIGHVSGVSNILTDANAVAICTAGTSEQIRIGGDKVGIGTTSPSAQLELSTDSAKKPSTNTWTITSDQRLKTNITNADNDRCYEIVKQVPLKRYTWKSEVYSQEKVKDRSKLGWIAQDVEEVFPKAVGTSRFAYNQVFEDVITPELDSDGNAVLDENGIAKIKTEKRLVSEDVIEDCKDLNSDQIYAAMYGTIQKLIEKVESLESKVAALEAA
jgi:hypothetical protein